MYKLRAKPETIDCSTLKIFPRKFDSTSEESQRFLVELKEK